jgi:ABC-2 type transport system ATP-binding protein
LTVKEGEIYGFLGQNGAGKTTTIKCLLGLIKPDSGEMLFFDRQSNTVRGRENIGFLPEHPYFYDYLTVEELLLFTAKLFSMKKEQYAKKIYELIEKVGMNGKEKLKLRKLSKGMIQRVGLAQALINDPKILILDEPFSGLDPIGRKEVRDIILSLKDSGKTVFFSSHILQDMEMIADRVGIVLNGKVIKEGVLSEMISNQISYYEISFRGVNKEILKTNGFKYIKRGELFVIRVEKNEKVNELIEFLIMNKGKVDSVNKVGQNLEDVFLKEIGQ